MSGDDPSSVRSLAGSIFLLVLTLSISPPLFAAIKLVPVISGLSSPVFVVPAGDGSRRLFVVEQEGTIRVYHASASTTSVFLDVRDKGLAGGERGLLGLAFHPLYAFNGRFSFTTRVIRTARSSSQNIR